MATFVLIHGAADVAWYWHLVDAELRKRGHGVVAVDLPCDDDSAGLSEYTDAVVDAIPGDRTDLVVVGQSLGGLTAPLVCERVGADLLVLVAAMIPSPGEKGAAWWANTGHDQAAAEDAHDGSDIAVFLHDVAPDLASEALSRGRAQSDTPMQEPWPLDAWPDVPTRYLLCRRDRLFPAEWTRGMVRDRLGITPDEMDCGHTPALSRPGELADRLEAYAASVVS